MLPEASFALTKSSTVKAVLVTTEAVNTSGAKTSLVVVEQSLPTSY